MFQPSSNIYLINIGGDIKSSDRENGRCIVIVVGEGLAPPDFVSYSFYAIVSNGSI